jgi:voltage-gated potassium channel
MQSETTDLVTDVDGDRLVEQRQLVVRPTYEAFIVGLSALQLVNSILLLVLSEPTERALVLGFFALVALVLLADMLVRLRAIPDKERWLRKLWGWMIVVGSIPLPFISVARLLRYRLFLSRTKPEDVQDAFGMVVRQRAGGLLLTALLAAVVVLEFGSLAMLRVEQGAPGANIDTAGDAVWWGFVTVATVGYGDRYPVTAAGRVIGVLMMIVGVALFSLFTSYLAQDYIQARERERSRAAEKRAGVAAAGPEDDLDAFRRLLDAQEATVAELRARLAVMEAKRDGQPQEPGPTSAPRR